MPILFDSTRPINAPAAFGRPRPKAQRTATQPAAAPRPTKAPDVCRLTLTIRGTDYTVKPVYCAPEIGAKAYRLRKLDGSGTSHYVLAGVHGAECDCGDYIYRHHGYSTTCKHVKAMLAVGLVSEGGGR